MSPVARDPARRRESKLDPAELSFFADLQRMIRPSSSNHSNKLRLIAGVDASYIEEKKKVLAVAVTFSFDETILEISKYFGKFTFPYVPGLFYLHEGPFVVAAVKLLKKKPDLICFDAHGRAHPRRLGMASLCGKMLDIPSVGIAKSKLFGSEAAYKEGLWRIFHLKETLGFVTRGLGGVGAKRFWSPGHSVSILELEKIIHERGSLCIRAIDEAHKISLEIHKN